MSVVARATAATTLLTSASKRSAIWRCKAFFSSSACCLEASCASRMVRASIMLRRNTSTAPAMVPSSSFSGTAGYRHRGIAARKAVHHRGDRGQRAGQTAAEQERQHNGAAKNRGGAKNKMALRTCRRRLIFGGVLDQLDDSERVHRVGPDL